MSDYLRKQPPRFVPTLTQAVEQAATDTMAEPLPTAAADLNEAVVPPHTEAATAPPPAMANKTVAPPKKLLEELLDERINALVAHHIRQLEMEIRAEIKNALKEQRNRFFERRSDTADNA